MALKDRYNFEYLENEAERLVFDELEAQFADPAYKDICTCPDCVLDMAALALNSLKPVYRVSLIGKMYAEALDRTGYAEEVKQAVKNAIEKISSTPSHEWP